MGTSQPAARHHEAGHWQPKPWVWQQLQRLPSGHRLRGQDKSIPNPAPSNSLLNASHGMCPAMPRSPQHLLPTTCIAPELVSQAGMGLKASLLSMGKAVTAGKQPGQSGPGQGRMGRMGRMEAAACQGQAASLAHYVRVGASSTTLPGGRSGPRVSPPSFYR